MDLTWNVGDTEHHTVSLRYSRLRNTVWLAVDGATVQRDIMWTWIPARRHYEVDVGDSEGHHVSVDLAFRRVGAKFNDPTVELRVDGTLIMTGSTELPST